VDIGGLAVTGGNSRALLTAMLQGVEAEERQARNLSSGHIETKHAAFIMHFIVLK
jgi:hypothetical protein